jgi:hypothetical protein
MRITKDFWLHITKQQIGIILYLKLKVDIIHMNNHNLVTIISGSSDVSPFEAE